MGKFKEKIRSLLLNAKEQQKALQGFARIVILTPLVVTGSILGLRHLGVMQEFELRAYDRLIQHRPDEGADDRLLVVGITEEDILKYKEFPISDETLANVLSKIEQYQPRAIGLDILRDIPLGTGRAKLIEKFARNDKIIAACKLSSAREPGNPAPPGVPPERIGFADVPLDPDIIIRRSILISTPSPPSTPIETPHLCNDDDLNNQIPSLAFNLALLYLEQEEIYLDQTEEGDLQLGSVVLKRLGTKAGGYQKTGASDYQILLNYRSAQNAAQQVTLTEILEGNLDPALVSNRIVLIGYTAQSANDDFPTPYSSSLPDNKKMPGVFIHAQSLSQILSAVLDHRPLIWYWPIWAEIFWIWSWSVVGATLAWKIKRPWIFYLCAIASSIFLVGTCYGFFLLGGWLPLVTPVAALLGTAGSVILVDRYAQNIYEGVKGVLKLNIEIDTEKKRERSC